jgi:hypothetical protein
MNAGDFANSLYRNGGSGAGAGRTDPVFSKPPTAAQLQAKKASALAPYAPGPARTGRTPWPVQSDIHANRKYFEYLDGLGSQPRQQSSRLVPNGTTAEQASQMAASAQKSSAPNMSMYTSGQAQPRQQSPGTPYGQSPYSAYTAGSSKPRYDSASNQPQSASKSDLVRQRLAAGGSLSLEGATNRARQAAENLKRGIPDPLYPGAQPSPSGPAQFNQPQGGLQMRTVNFDGSVTRQPNFALRDAFAQNINSAMTPYYQNSGTYLGEGAPPPTWGQAPQFNFPQLYGQATNMVADGYQNPLAGLFG